MHRSLASRPYDKAAGGVSNDRSKGRKRQQSLSGKVTFHVKLRHGGIQAIGGAEQNLDVPDEPLRDENAIHVRAVAHVQQHVGDARGRRLLKGRENAPYAVHLLLHALLLLLDELPRGRLISGHGRVIGLVRRRQPDIPELVDHVALGMPVLVLAVSKDLDELLQDGRLAAVTPLGELRRVVVVAVYVTIVLVVTVLRSKNRGTERAGEMVYVVLSVEGRDVRATQRSAALVAEQAKPSEVVSLAQGILTVAVLVIGREELGRNNLATVLCGRPFG